MDNGNIRTKIGAALAAMPGNDFAPAAQRLLDTLGYRSQRTLSDQSGAVDSFINTFPTIRWDSTTATQSERAFRKQTASVRIIFQIANAEIAAARRHNGRCSRTTLSTAATRRASSSWPWS